MAYSVHAPLESPCSSRIIIEMLPEIHGKVLFFQTCYLFQKQCMPCSTKFSKTFETEILSTEISDFLK